MPEFTESIDEALGIITGISAIGGAKLRKKLQEAGARNIQDLDQWMHEADQLAYFFQWNWKSTARAWILVTYIARYWAGPEMGAQPSRGEREEAINRLRTASAILLRSQLTDLVSGREVLRMFLERQRHPSRVTWSNTLTSPRAHRQDNFLYLIHAMRPQTGLTVNVHASPLRAAYLARQLHGYIGARDIAANSWQLLSAKLFLTEPERLWTEVLSCSVINSQRVKTYGDCSFGFVLEAPAANICVAAGRDLAASGTQHMARGDKLAAEAVMMNRLLAVDDFITNLIDGFYPPEVLSPAEVLRDTNFNAHNEVLVVGSIGSSRVRPTAIFIKVTHTGRLWTSFLADDVQYRLAALIGNCARRLGIPIIAIPDSRGKASKISFDFWVNNLGL